MYVGSCLLKIAILFYLVYISHPIRDDAIEMSPRSLDQKTRILGPSCGNVGLMTCLIKHR